MPDQTAVPGIAVPEGPERRQTERYPMFCILDDLIAGVDAYPVSVRNLSVGGISLVVSHRIEPETQLTVCLDHAVRNFFAQLPIKVVYVVEHPGGEFILDVPLPEN